MFFNCFYFPYYRSPDDMMKCYYDNSFDMILLKKLPKEKILLLRTVCKKYQAIKLNWEKLIYVNYREIRQQGIWDYSIFK